MRLSCVQCGATGARPFEDSAPYEVGAPRALCATHGPQRALTVLEASREPVKDFRVADTSEQFSPRFVGMEFEMFHRTHNTNRVEHLAVDWRLANCGMGEDGSIHSNAGIEVKTPPASGDDIPLWVEAVCSTAAHYGMRVDDSCGLHVHVDVRDYDSHAFRRLLRLMRSLEPVLYAALPAHRLYNGTAHVCAVPLQTIENIRGSDSFARAWGNYNQHDRYHGCNFAAIREHGTVEMRYHSGTLHAQKVTAWARLMQAAVDAAKAQAYRDIPVTFSDFDDRLNSLTRLLGVEGLKPHLTERITYFKHNLRELELLLAQPELTVQPASAPSPSDMRLDGEPSRNGYYCALHQHDETPTLCRTPFHDGTELDTSISADEENHNRIVARLDGEMYMICSSCGVLHGVTPPDRLQHSHVRAGGWGRASLIAVTARVANRQRELGRTPRPIPPTLS